MQAVRSVVKHATGAKRGEKCNRCAVHGKMQPVQNAGKHATTIKRPVERGRYATGAEARENVGTPSHDWFCS